MAQVSAERSEPVAAPAANPAPLGLSGFALTTFVLSVVNAGILTGTTDIKIVIGLAFFYGGAAQILAGMWEFRAGNTFGATAFTSYGAFWLAVAISVQQGFIPSHAAFAWFLLGWTIFTGLMFLGTLRSNVALMGVFGLLFITFLLLAINEFQGAPSGNAIGIIGGYFGIATALVAWYTALAGVLASGRATFTLPVGPRS